MKQTKVLFGYFLGRKACNYSMIDKRPYKYAVLVAQCPEGQAPDVCESTPSNPKRNPSSKLWHR